MRGLIVEFVGVLDGTEEDVKRWRSRFAAAKANGVATAILSNDPGGPGAAECGEHRAGDFAGIGAGLVLGDVLSTVGQLELVALRAPRVPR